MNKIVLRILSGVFALIAIGCMVYLGMYYYQNAKGEKTYDDIRDLVDTTVVSADDTSTETAVIDSYTQVDNKMIQKKFKRIYEANKDYIGWLYITGTQIDYPVMQTIDDEEYYIKRDFYKKSASYGSLFMDAQSAIGVFNPKTETLDSEYTSNMIIYGHNMKSGTMFHDLMKFEDEDFYKAHKYINFDTIYEDGTYEVIAAFRTQIYPEDSQAFKYYNYESISSQEDFDTYITNIKSLTPYSIDTDAEYGDTLITLSTCAYHTEEGRFVVVAKKIG